MGYYRKLFINKSYSCGQKTLMFVLILFVSSLSSIATMTTNNNSSSNSNNNHNSSSNNNNSSNSNSNSNSDDSSSETLASQKMVTRSNLTLFVKSPTTDDVCTMGICQCKSWPTVPGKHTVSCQNPDTLKEIPLMRLWTITVNITELYVFKCMTFNIVYSTTRNHR